MKASLTNSPALLHQRSRIQPPHHLPQGTLLRLVLSTPSIEQKTLSLSGIRGYRLMMTWNQTLIMFIWQILLLLALFEGQTWGWDGINRCAVVEQNRNAPSSKHFPIPQSLSCINIFLHSLLIKWIRIVLISSMPSDMKEADISLLTFVYPLLYLGVWILMYT